jgi:hypothetical protein
MDLGSMGIYGASKFYGYLQEVTKISQNYYPERMGCLIFHVLTGRQVLPYQCPLGIYDCVECY